MQEKLEIVQKSEAKKSILMVSARPQSDEGAK